MQYERVKLDLICVFWQGERRRREKIASSSSTPTKKASSSGSKEASHCIWGWHQHFFFFSLFDMHYISIASHYIFASPFESMCMWVSDWVREGLHQIKKRRRRRTTRTTTKKNHAIFSLNLFMGKNKKEREREKELDTKGKSQKKDGRVSERWRGGWEGRKRVKKIRN